MKTCTKCNTNKELNKFYILSNGHLRSKCKDCCSISNKLWIKNHPSSSKERYARDKTKMLMRNKIWQIKNKDILKEKRFKYYTNNIPKILLKSSLHRAKVKGLEHTLKETDIIVPTICPVLGIQISHQKTNGIPHPNSPTIDRIDNNKGYTPDNIIVVSRRANVLKNDASMEELRKIISFYDNITNKK